MKRLWKKFVDYTTDKVIANNDICVFGVVVNCFLGITDVGINIFRHRTNLEDYWFGLLLLFLAILYGFLLARARAVRSLRSNHTK